MNRASPEVKLEIDLGYPDTKAFFAIDRLVGGTSWGGLRIVPDGSLQEALLNARAMTQKCGFVGIKRGGAKLVLQLPSAFQSHRQEIVRNLGKELAPFLRTGKWIPGLDMGCTIEDIRDLFRGADMERDLSGWKDIAPFYTALSVYYSTLAALESLATSIGGKRFAVQGFGRVGVEYCKLISDAGAILVAISTSRGALYNANGLDIDSLVRRRQEEGDSFVCNYPDATMIDPDTLLLLDVDVAVPCARASVIHEENWKRVTARIIPCAANAPMELGVEERLHQSGKIVITDFVANCGGVFGSTLERYLDVSEIRTILQTTYFRKVRRIIDESRKSTRSVGVIALETVTEHLQHSDTIFGQLPYRFGPVVLSCMPDFLRRKSIQRFCTSQFF